MSRPVVMKNGRNYYKYNKDEATNKDGTLKKGFVVFLGKPNKRTGKQPKLYYKPVGAAPAKKAAPAAQMQAVFPTVTMAPAAPAKKARAKRGQAKPPAAAYWVAKPKRQKALSQTKRNIARRKAYAAAVLPAKVRACKKIGMIKSELL